MSFRSKHHATRNLDTASTLTFTWFFDSAWHVGHDMSYGLALLMVFPSLRRCCRVPLQVSRGASGACVRRAERVGSPRPVFWHSLPHRVSCHPTNKIYSTTVAMKNSAVFMWFLSMSHHNKKQLGISGWRTSTTLRPWRVDLRFVKFGTRDSFGTIGGSNVHMLWTMDVDTYCTNLHIFAYSQGSNTTQYEFYSNQTWCPQLALSHCPGRDHKAKVAPQWQISHTISDMEMKTVMQAEPQILLFQI